MNEAPNSKLDTLETPEQFREAIGTLATGIVELQTILKEKEELIKGMDNRIKLLIMLIDRHGEALVKLGALPPRPKGDPLAN